MSQAFEIFDKLGSEKMLIINYEDLINTKQQILPLIYKFINLEYRESYSEKIHARSINKSDHLSVSEREIIDRISLPIYQKDR